MPKGQRTAIFLLALVAVALTIVGCVSTWAKAAGHSFSGTDANAGKTVMIGAIAAIILLALATWTVWRWAAVVAAIPAAIAAAIAAYRLADIKNFVGGFDNATAAWGIWLATIAAIALFVLCVLHALLPKTVVDRATPAEPAAPPPPPETTAP